MNQLRAKESKLYDNLCHAVLILQAMKTIQKDKPDYILLQEKKKDCLSRLMKDICKCSGTRKTLINTLTELHTLTKDNPEVHQRVLTLYQTLDEKPPRN